MEEKEGKSPMALCLKPYSVSKFHKHCNCKESKRKDMYMIHETTHSW